MLASLLALGSSLCWGISDFLGGVKGRSLPLPSILLISQGSALLLLIALVMLWAEPPPELSFLGFAAAAGLGEILGVAALYRGLSMGKMGVVAPIANTAPIVPFVWGLWLGEVPETTQFAGLGLIVMGILMTSSHRTPGDAAGSQHGPSVLYGLLAAFGFGLFFIGMDAASEGGILWSLLACRFTAVTLLGLSLGVFRPAKLSLSRRDLPSLLSIGLLVVGADFLYATASTRGLLGVVAVLSALHPVVTVGLARVFLHERIAPLQYAGIAACIAGVAAITGS